MYDFNNFLKLSLDENISKFKEISEERFNQVGFNFKGKFRGVTKSSIKSENEVANSPSRDNLNYILKPRLRLYPNEKVKGVADLTNNSFSSYYQLILRKNISSANIDNLFKENVFSYNVLNVDLNEKSWLLDFNYLHNQPFYFKIDDARTIYNIRVKKITPSDNENNFFVNADLSSRIFIDNVMFSLGFERFTLFSHLRRIEFLPSLFSFGVSMELNIDPKIRSFMSGFVGYNLKAKNLSYVKGVVGLKKSNTQALIIASLKSDDRFEYYNNTLRPSFKAYLEHMVTNDLILRGYLRTKKDKNDLLNTKFALVADYKIDSNSKVSSQLSNEGVAVKFSKKFGSNVRVNFLQKIKLSKPTSKSDDKQSKPLVNNSPSMHYGFHIEIRD